MFVQSHDTIASSIKSQQTKMATKRTQNCGQSVYKIYRRTFESYIDTNNEAKIRSKLYLKGFLTKEESDIGSTVTTLRAAIRENIESNDGEEKFLLLLEVYESFRDVDVTSIREVLEKEKQGKTSKRRASMDNSQIGKKPPPKGGNKKSDSSSSLPPQRKMLPPQKTYDKKLAGTKYSKDLSESVLPPIAGSPSSDRKDSTTLIEANNCTESPLSTTVTQSIQGAIIIAQETDITHTQYPKSTTFPFESDSGIHEEVQCIEVLQREYTDTVTKMTQDTIAKMSTALKKNTPGLRSKYATLVEHCKKLEEKVQLFEHSSKVQEKKVSEKCKQNVKLMQELEQKQEEIRNLTAKIEKAKKEEESIRLKMVQPQSVYEEIKFSQEIVKDIHKVLSEEEDTEEQYKMIKTLHVFQRELLKFRNRPASTGGLRQ